MSETDKIKETLQYFFEGFDNLDTELICKAFHQTAFLMEITPNGLMSMSQHDWYAYLNSIKEDKNHPFIEQRFMKTIKTIDVTGTAASVKVEWESETIRFTDYYNMLKVDEKWLIMNKIYTTEIKQ